MGEMRVFRTATKIHIDGSSELMFTSSGVALAFENSGDEHNDFPLVLNGFRIEGFGGPRHLPWLFPVTRSRLAACKTLWDWSKEPAEKAVKKQAPLKAVQYWSW